MRKTKKCRICKASFQPATTTQIVCSIDCAIEYAKRQREKAFKRQTMIRKRKLKSRSDYLREAQAAFNKYIRLRDDDQKCISCGCKTAKQFHAGHYRSVGSCPELRFYSLNCFKQCSSCNNYLSGNLINYRKNLVEKLGQEKVDWLESNHQAKHYSKDDLQRLKLLFNRKCKWLKAKRESN